MKVAYPARIVFQKDDNSYLVEFPDLEGCFTEGKTIEGARKNAQEALSEYLESMIDRSIKVPFPSKRKGGNVYYIQPDSDIVKKLEEILLD